MKMHLSDGELRAYLDRQPGRLDAEQVKAHLQACQPCRSRLETLSGRAQEVGSRLSSLEPVRSAPPVGVSFTHLQVRMTDKEKTGMWKKIFSPRYRFAWVVLAFLVILGVALTIPSVGAIANSFLGLFRVQQVTFVGVDPGDLPERLSSSSQFEVLLSQNLQVQESGPAQDVATAVDAEQLVGYTLRLPAALDNQSGITVQPAASAAFNVDLKRIQAILDEVGRSDIVLPTDLDGATVSIELPAGVMAQYGTCELSREAIPQPGHDPDASAVTFGPDCTTLLQMPSPSISAPPGLDVAAIGQAYMQVLGMSPDEAASFAQNVDWTTTLVVPVPRYGTTYQEVVVDGVTGALIQQPGDFEYLLFWVKDGMVYALSGQGAAQTALEIGNSLK
jgi:hypothetical protein